MSDQCSLRLPPGNPRKRKSEDNLHGQLKKAPPMDTPLSNPVQATSTQSESATEDTPADDVLSIENMAQMASNSGSIFESPWAKKCSQKAVECIICCWAADSSLIPQEDIDRWCDEFPFPEMTLLSVLAWHFGPDKFGQDDLRSFISSFPNDELRDIWSRNRFRRDWSFKAFEDFEYTLRNAKHAFQHPAFAGIAVQSHEVQKVIELDLQEWLQDFHML
ncbi:uncharacterized protein BDCG_07081 [Blastomyces dermatitidis ER-3]|uniref:Uncharacterized protein n=1 Tax=Ajellomyces dermatitidis (strain ER-3 / ATCC MYA-2586) TaxID=559297 RepID=A0ABP2F7D9_AJEDR|nr:uncharacterized protein BDCG_07081 [Blastomyces dermatitidis ER-3]EEQ91961.1 hypothetical protein BDCG_07081 [Blastomyces dermatitidis ER-3]